LSPKLRREQPVPEYIECPVLSRKGSRVIVDTPIGHQELNLGWFSSRFTYIGSTVKSSTYMDRVAIPMTLARRMTGEQKKCGHPVLLYWETPWRFSIFQAESLARFMLCPQCGLSVGLRLE
jgi:hypothetical protein